MNDLLNNLLKGLSPCPACNAIANGVKTTVLLVHTCGRFVVVKKSASIGPTEFIPSGVDLWYLSISGYAGVLPTGKIVDRLIYPEAMPLPENKLLGIPAPKDIKQ
ncbi:MAG TPA: hypothetical protein VGE79_08935 [Niastella sp.]